MTARLSNGCAALCAAAWLALSAAAAGAAPAYVKSTVNLRSGPATTNEIVVKIPGGSLVETGQCNDGWCAVSWQGKGGYAIQTALDTSGRVPTRQVARAPVPPAAYGDEVVVGGPAYYGPPAMYYGYPYPYYRPFGYYRYRPYYGYRYGGWRRRW